MTISEAAPAPCGNVRRRAPNFQQIAVLVRTCEAKSSPRSPCGENRPRVRSRTV